MTVAGSLLAWLARGLAASSMAAALAGVALTAARSQSSEVVLVPALVALAAGAVGALILDRFPRHAVGWLLLGGGVAAAAVAAGEAYGPSSLPGAASAAWVASWAGGPLVGCMLGMLLVFPDGRLASPRWRPLAVLTVVAVTLLTLGSAAGDALSENHPLYGGGIGWPLVSLAMLGVFVQLAVRYRCSGVEQRQQIKWPALAVAVWVLGSVASIVSFEAASASSSIVAMAIAMAGAVGLPVSIGIAVLRYRLFDIDVVISKTVVFAGLAGFITAVYVAIVVGVGSVIGAGGEPNLGLSIVATAVVAVAFQPARERLTRLANRLVYGRRATPYEVLSRFSSQVGETVATEQTLEHMARLLAEGTGAARAQVWLKVGEQMRSAASWPAEAVPYFAPVVLANGSLPAFAEVDLAIPVSHDGQLLGALTLIKKRGEPVTPTERGLVEDLAAQAGLVLRNVGLTAELYQRLEELRDSRRRLVEAQDQERRRLERDLHDGAQQQLVALKLKLNLAKTLAQREGAVQTASLVGQTLSDADDAVATLRELAHGIYPPLLAAEGLAAALAAQARKAAIPVQVVADGVGRYPQELEAAVYFCVLEALSNTAKYAQATHATVALSHADGQLAFTVTDDGVGFDPATTPKGHGMTNMADRLDALGGNLQIVSAPGVGTSVCGSIPVNRGSPPDGATPEQGTEDNVQPSQPDTTHPA